MDDLISRQAAIELWEEYHPYIAVKACEYGKRLRSLPSAERRGKKKVYYHGKNTFSYVCDQCAMPIDGKDAFCKWCGAKMEE